MVSSLRFGCRLTEVIFTFLKNDFLFKISVEADDDYNFYCPVRTPKPIRMIFMTNS